MQGTSVKKDTEKDKREHDPEQDALPSHRQRYYGGPGIIETESFSMEMIEMKRANEEEQPYPEDKNDIKAAQQAAVQQAAVQQATLQAAPSKQTAFNSIQDDNRRRQEG